MIVQKEKIWNIIKSIIIALSIIGGIIILYLLTLNFGVRVGYPD